MTYVYEYVVGNDNVKVEYCHSSVSGNKALMDRWEKDMTDRMCGTGEYSTELDLDRDVPMMEAV